MKLTDEEVSLLIEVAQEWLETYDDIGNFSEEEYPELWKQIAEVKLIIKNHESKG